MDVKNKVDENVDENVVKKDKPKPDLSLEVGKLVGYYDVISDSKKDAENARTAGILIGAGAMAIGYIIGCGFMTILSNKHRN